MQCYERWSRVVSVRWDTEGNAVRRLLPKASGKVMLCDGKMVGRLWLVPGRDCWSSVANRTTVLQVGGDILCLDSCRVALVRWFRYTRLVPVEFYGDQRLGVHVAIKGIVHKYLSS